METVLAVQTIALVAAGILFCYLVKQAKALDRTVKAQATHLDSLKGLADTMKTVLDSTDERRMLQRLQAFKEFSNEEIGMREKRFERDLAESRALASNAVLALSNAMSAMARLASSFMPFVPVDTRTQLIAQKLTVTQTSKSEVRVIETAVLDQWRDGLIHIAGVSPELTGLERLAFPTLQDVAQTYLSEAEGYRHSTEPKADA